MMFRGHRVACLQLVLPLTGEQWRCPSVQSASRDAEDLNAMHIFSVAKRKAPLKNPA